MMRFAPLGAIGLALFGALAGFETLHAQDPPPDKAAETYRRIFVPEEELQSQVKGLLPVRRADFERLIAAAKNGSQAPPASAQVAVAEYTARLVNAQWLTGEASWQIALRASGGGTLSLEPCNLAFGKGTWDGDSRTAQLGVGPQGSLQLLADEAGTVRIPWSRRGEAIEEGGVQFSLQLPPALVSRLKFSAPPELTLEAEPGVVTRLTDTSSGDGLVTWQVEAGPATQVSLRWRSGAPSRAGGDLTLLKEEATFNLTPADYSAEFRFLPDVHGAGLRAVSLRIDPALTVTWVRLGPSPLNWSIADAESTRTLNIEFPQPLSAGGRALVIQAVGKLPTGAAWRLPRPVWPGGLWQEGTAVVRVPAGLDVAVTAMGDSRQVAQAAGGAPGSALRFQYHSAAGVVELSASRRVGALSSATGATIQFDVAQVSATLRSDLTVLDGERFEVDVVVSNEWIVDSLESVPPEVLEDRPVIAQDERQRTLRLRLARPITPQRPLRIVVRAHRQQADQTLTSDELWRWLRFVGVSESPGILALRSNLPNVDLQVMGDIDAARLDPESASAEELARMDSPPSGLLYRIEPEAIPFQIILRPGQPRYAATIECAAEVDRSLVRQRTVVHCVPEGPGISRLTVRSSPPPEREIRWRLTGSDAAVVAQTRRDVAASPGHPLAEAVWELELSRPVTQPFALESSWESPRQPRHVLALFACEEATKQDGTARVDVADDTRLTLEAAGLLGVPIVSPSPDRFTTTRGLFRYQPGQPASLAAVERGEATLLPEASVRSAVLVTRFGANGAALHELALELANAGQTHLGFSLPSTALLLEAAVDGREVSSHSGDRESQFLLPLPEGKRLVRTRITYTTPQQPLTLRSGTWSAPLPRLALPVGEVEWIVALPRGVRPATSSAERRQVVDQLSQRFFGVFVDEADEPARWLRPWVARDASAAEMELEGNSVARDAVAALPPGWTVHRIPSQWRSELELVTYQGQVMRIFGQALGMLCGVIAWSLARRWKLFLLATLVLVIAATIAVPVAAAPLTAGALWGLVVGWGTALLKPRSAALQPVPESRVSTTRLLAGAAGSVLFLWLAGLGSHGPSADAAPPGNGPSIARVVIPVDSDGKPAGDYVYVDETLYDRLHRNGEKGSPGEAWLVRQARYEVRWPDPGSAAAVRAFFELETFGSNTLVTLPFSREQVVLEQGGVRRDGTIEPAAWHESGTGLTISVPTAGRSQVEIAFSAPVRMDEGVGELRVAIPSAPSSTASLDGPDELRSALDVVTAQGAKRDDAGKSLSFDLGSAGELIIRAQSAGEGERPPQAAEAEQLCWWKVRPGSVSVDILCKFRSLGDRLDHVALRFDPRLRLLPLEPQAAIARTFVQEGAMSTLHLIPVDPTAAELSVRLRFLLADASGVGKLIPPLLSPVAERITRNWVAISTGAGLESPPPQEHPSVPLAPGDFAQIFGSGESPPQLAYDVSAQSTALEFVVRPESARPTASAETTLMLGRRQHLLEFRGTIGGLALRHLQHRLTLPPEWEARRVAVREAGAPVPTRWFQGADGVVVVHLDHAAEQLELQLEATRIADGQPSLAVPAIGWIDVALEQQTLRIFRGHDLRVAVTAHDGWDRDDSPVATQEENAGRLVARFRAASADPSRQIKLTLAPNEPQVSARLVSRLSNTAGSWESLLVFDLQVTGGLLDGLRLDVPPEWAQELEATPPMQIRSVVVPGQSHRHVHLLPDAPWDGKVRLELRGPLRVAAAEPPRLPAVSLLDVPVTERYVQLPQLAAAEERWETTGLQAAPLPEDLRSGPLGEGGYEMFVAVGPQIDAFLKRSESPTVAPRVTLAEYELQWRVGGPVQGTAHFHLVAPGVEQVTLELPRYCQPIFVTVDGLPAETTADEYGGTIRLPRSPLPHRLSVAFLGRERPGESGRVLDAPTIANLPAEATIWTLRTPDDVSLTAADLQLGSESTQFAQDLARLKSISALLAEAAQSELGRVPRESRTSWLLPWRTEAHVTMERSRRHLRSIVGDGGADAEAFEQLAAEVEERIGNLAGSDAQAPSVSSADDDEPPRLHVWRGTMPGEQAHVIVEARDPRTQALASRLAWAAAVLVVGLAAMPLARWRLVQDWAASTGPFLIALAGILMVVGTPLGLSALVVVLLGVWLSLRRVWVTAPAERASSIISRSGAA